MRYTTKSVDRWAIPVDVHSERRRNVMSLVMKAILGGLVSILAILQG